MHLPSTFLGVLLLGFRWFIIHLAEFLFHLLDEVVVACQRNRNPRGHPRIVRHAPDLHAADIPGQISVFPTQQHGDRVVIRVRRDNAFPPELVEAVLKIER